MPVKMCRQPLKVSGITNSCFDFIFIKASTKAIPSISFLSFLHIRVQALNRDFLWTRKVDSTFFLEATEITSARRSSPIKCNPKNPMKIIKSLNPHRVTCSFSHTKNQCKCHEKASLSKFSIFQPGFGASQALHRPYQRVSDFRPANTFTLHGA